MPCVGCCMPSRRSCPLPCAQGEEVRLVVMALRTAAGLRAAALRSLRARQKKKLAAGPVGPAAVPRRADAKFALGAAGTDHKPFVASPSPRSACLRCGLAVLLGWRCMWDWLVGALVGWARVVGFADPFTSVAFHGLVVGGPEGARRWRCGRGRPHLLRLRGGWSWVRCFSLSFAHVASDILFSVGCWRRRGGAALPAAGAGSRGEKVPGGRHGRSPPARLSTGPAMSSSHPGTDDLVGKG